MKIKNYVEDLKTKSAAELQEELVAAKKELFNLRFCHLQLYQHVFF